MNGLTSSYCSSPVRPSGVVEVECALRETAALLDKQDVLAARRRGFLIAHVAVVGRDRGAAGAGIAAKVVVENINVQVALLRRDHGLRSIDLGGVAPGHNAGLVPRRVYVTEQLAGPGCWLLRVSEGDVSPAAMMRTLQHVGISITEMHATPGRVLMMSSAVERVRIQQWLQIIGERNVVAIPEAVRAVPGMVDERVVNATRVAGF
ncbi:MAG: hypothetical protein ACR2GY_02155 [Phycisphaerales bacterium]